MSPRPWSLALALIVAVGAVPVRAADKEPVEGGKTLSEWRKLLTSKTAEERMKAADALGSLGERAKASIPDLLEVLNKDKEYEVRESAAAAIELIAHAADGKGPEIKAAIPVLIKVLNDPKAPDHKNQVREKIVHALGRIGSKVEALAKMVVPTLIDVLKDKDFNMIGFAADNLGRIAEHLQDAGKKPPAELKKAVPVLVKLLRHEEEVVQDNAKDALKKIDPEAAKKAGIR